jgi:hypothetical protein
MDRADFEHVIAAAANVLDADEFVVVGSQAILGPHPDAPSELLRSLEADIYPARQPERAEELDGALGDGSQFARTYGYFAHGVGPESIVAPAGWNDRLVRVEIPPRPRSSRHPVAYCLEPHDLILAKCAAGRPRDWDFAAAALKAAMVDPGVLFERLDELPVEEERRAQIRAMLEARIPRD